MRRKPKGQPDAPLAPVPSEILDQFVRQVLTDDGPLPIEVPRDREGTFEPRLIAKHERRFAGVDDKILALYARGMTVREIQAVLAEMYAVRSPPI